MTTLSPDFATATRKELHVYADGSSGDDDNDGLSVGSPKKTLQAVLDLIPDVIAHNTSMHLKGTFTDQFILVSRHIKQFARFIIDGGDDLTQLAGVFTSTAPETDIRHIGDSLLSLTPDQYKGYWIEVTSGPAAGEIRNIQQHDATTFTPCVRFSVDPGVGATFRVVRPTTTIQASVGVSFISIQLTGFSQYAYVQRLYFDGCSLFSNDCSIGVTHIIQENITFPNVAFWVRGGSQPAIWSGRNDPDTFAFVSRFTSGAGMSALGTGLWIWGGWWL